MNDLLKNEKFRKKLCRWVVMYLSVIALTTTVITYSKYVSRLYSSVEGRTASFAIDIKTECTEESEGFCKTNSYRPTSDMVYEFSVDTSQLEVTTLFALTVNIEPRFKVVSVSKKNDSDSEYSPTSDFELREQTDSETNSVTNKSLFFKKRIPAATGDKVHYKVVVRYDKDLYDVEKEIITENVVSVAYSAKQLMGSDSNEFD